jgi:nicotinamide phosphoribosyltransferase
MSLPSDNIILRTDSYKASHFLQYPPGTTRLLGYFESRGGLYGETVFFGLQYLLEEYLSRRVRDADVTEAAAFFAAHGLPFPEEGWRYIARDLDGRLPVRIRAVPEGAVVPVRNALMTVESMDQRVPWIVSWLETQLVRMWYPLTVATLSWHIKRRIFEYLARTSDDPMGELPYKLHDFGARGVSSAESAGIGGIANLVNFRGSDTVEGVMFARRYYGAEMAGVSIPAAEHSTVTAWGRERERDAYRNFVEQFLGPGKYPIAACVSDSYDLWNAIETIWCEELRDLIEASGSTLVIRPDSGDPSEVNVRALKILERKVGCRINTKGYKVLPHSFRLIQGDGNDDEEAIDRVLRAITSHGFSASNIAFGMGGGLLQRVHRDTQKIAFKICEATVDGRAVPVSKSPVTDAGKASKSGNLDLVMVEGRYHTVPGPRPDSALVTVFENGEILRRWTFDEVRARAQAVML